MALEVEYEHLAVKRHVVLKVDLVWMLRWRRKELIGVDVLKCTEYVAGTGENVHCHLTVHYEVF
jgi:hypothetical protein